MAENRADFVIGDLDTEDDVREIQRELDDEDGILSTEIDLETGEAKILFDYDLLSEEEVKRTVRDLGYDVESSTHE